MEKWGKFTRTGKYNNNPGHGKQKKEKPYIFLFLEGFSIFFQFLTLRSKENGIIFPAISILNLGTTKKKQA